MHRLLLFTSFIFLVTTNAIPAPADAESRPTDQKLLPIEQVTTNGVTSTTTRVKHTLDQTRDALERFSSQSRTNSRYGGLGFVSFGIQSAPVLGSEQGLRLLFCACSTPAPYCEILAARLSTNETQLIIRSNYLDQANYCTQRDAQLLEELNALLAAKR